MPGTLSITERPRAGSVLQDLLALRNEGVDTVLSMLEPDEAAHLGLSNEADLCGAVGIRFMSRPIEDMALPTATDFLRTVEGAAEIIFHGGHLAVHCRAGIGRSGMFAATMLGLFDHDPQSAIEAVTSARGTPVPDTPEQAVFIEQMIGRLG